MTKIDLVTGFLGAGKTTFLARYGAWLTRNGVKFAVIENEYGAAGVDRTILGEQMDNVEELAGGCICCTLKSGFHAMLARLAKTYDRILVEPSGIYNMDDFFEVVGMLERDGLCQVGMCLTLVDPHTLSVLNEQERTVLRSELTGAGAVLWTKLDVEPAVDLQQAEAQTMALLDLPDAPSLAFYPAASHQLTDADFAALQQAGPVRRDHKLMFIHHAAVFQSTSLRPKGIYTAEQLLETLKTMQKEQSCGDIVRIKGFVRTHDSMLAVNCTVAEHTAVPCETRPVMLNFIGHQLDRAAIQQRLQASAESFASKSPFSRALNH